MSDTRTSLEAQLANLERTRLAIGRPGTEGASTIAAVLAATEARRAWDIANPSGREAYFVLLGLEEGVLEQLRRLDVMERARLAADKMAKRVELPERDLAAAREAKPTEAMQGAWQWWAMGSSRPRWLVLVGNVGTGKTVASVWCCLRAIEAGMRVEYVRTSALVRLSAFGDDGQRFDDYRKAGLLVVDDFGAENVTSYGQSLLGDILDDRHARRRLTVICTNLLGEALAERLGPRLVDRLTQDRLVIGPLGGPSLRALRAVGGGL